MFVELVTKVNTNCHSNDKLNFGYGSIKELCNMQCIHQIYSNIGKVGTTSYYNSQLNQIKEFIEYSNSVL